MLAQLLCDRAAQHPKHTALVYGDERWSWAELAEHVQALASGLKNRGIGDGDLVALWLDNSPAFVLSFFAVLARGAVVVPFNHAARPGDVATGGFDLAAVITSKRLEHDCRRALISTSEGFSTHFLVCPDPDTCTDWELIASDTVPLVRRDADDPALLQFSSGSTGQPKALYRTHGQCLAEVRHFHLTCNTDVNDRIFCAVALFHAHGMANALWAAVGSGATLVLMRNPQPFTLQWERALTLLQQENITIFPGVPLFFDTLAKTPPDHKVDLGKLRLCFSAGSELPAEVYRRFLQRFGVSIRNLYGCTEAGSVTINLDEDIDASAGTVGRPMLGIDIEIRSEDNQSLPVGDTGEVVFRSAALTSGYVDAPDLNRRCFADGWYCTGDMGRLDSLGRLELVGRKAFVIDVAGHKVYANEIEAVVCTHAGIEEAAAIGVPDVDSGEAIKVFVVGSGKLSETDVFAHCKAQLPSFKCPKHIEIVNALPKTAMGKIAKSQLA